MSISLINKERFNPSRLSNLALWLDGADSTTIGLSGNTTEVLTWKDKSSYSNNFFVQPVPFPPPVKDTVNTLISGTYTYVTSQNYFSVVTISLYGAGGGATSLGQGGAGGFAGYAAFADIPPNTTIDYTVGAAGTPGNGTGGGGGATTLTIGDNTVIAGGGGGGVKRSAGLPATQPFGGGIASDGSAGFVYNTTGITAPPPAGFVFTVGGGGEQITNGSISIAPSPSNYLVGSGTFDICAAINNSKITIYGARGGGSAPGLGGKVVYTGNLPAGTYSWYVGNRGNGQLGGSGYKPGINGIIVNPATQPFGGGDSSPANAGLVFTNGSTSTTEAGLTVSPGGGSVSGTDGRVSIELPPSRTNTYTSGDTAWVSPDYLSTLIIDLIGGAGGGGSSGTSSGGNSGGGGGRGTLTLTGVPPGTTFSYNVGRGGQGSKASGPISDDTITFGRGGTLYGFDGVRNGAGGGGVSMISYYDPVRAGYVILVAGGGGGGAGWSYYSSAGIVDGGPGGRGGATAGAPVGGAGGEIDPEFGFAGKGADGSIAWDTPGQAWNPIIIPNPGGGGAGGAAGNPSTGTNSGGDGVNGRIRFTATPLGNTADYTTPGQINFTPTATSTYVITVYGAGGSGGAGGRGRYTTSLTQNIPYPVTVGAKGIVGSGGGASTFGNFIVGANTGVILRGGGGRSVGTTGNGGGGSSALVFPSAYVIGAGGGGGSADQFRDVTYAGRGGGSDDNGANGGTQGGGQGVGFSIGSSPPSSSVSTTGGGNTEGITIEYDPTNINTPGSGSFIAQVSGAYTITVLGAGAGGKGGKGEYSTPPIPPGRNFTYSVGSAGIPGFPGGPTFISPFALAGGNATLRAGGGGSYTNQQVEGASGGGGIYGGLGGNPLADTNGSPGIGGSATLTGVTSVLGGGALKGATGFIYFTVSYTTPLSSPTLTKYLNSGVLFPPGYSAISSKLSGLGSAKTIMAVYQCSGTAASMNIGVGTSVSGGSFGICQTGGILYSPYQNGNGYDLTFTPSNYTAKSYAFASYNTTAFAITGMPGFNDASMNAVAFNNLITDTSLIIGRQLTGYPSEDFILSELIATSNALTSSDRQEVEGYLAAKWGLSTQLASSHPYKNFQPSGDEWIPPTLPTTISGLVSWLDMTIPGQTGTNIADRAGGSFSIHGTPPILSNINNHPSLYFSGTYTSGVVRDGSYPAIGSAVLIFSISATGSDTYPIIAFNGSPALAYTPPNLILGNTNGNDITDQPPISINPGPGPNIVFFAWTSSNYYLSANGGTLVVGSYATPSPSTRFVIGLFTGLTGLTPQMNFGEVVVYSQYFEQTERQLLEGYLAWKWNVEGKLPTDHPFGIQSPIGATVSETGALNIPAQIAGLTTWLDAADSATVSVGTGTTVTQWSDKSQSLDNFTPSSSDKAPIYIKTPVSDGPSIPGVYFLGTKSLLGTVNSGVGGTGVGTCFMVATIGTTGAQVLTGGVTGGVYQLGNSFGFVSANNSIISPFQGTDSQYANVLKNTYTLALTGPTVFFARINATANAGDGSFNFDTPANVGTEPIFWQPYTPSSTPWVLGHNSRYPNQQSFYLHEFLCFSTYFNDSQRQLVEGYLAWKWGIQSKLPVGHPYKNARPQSA